jgi:Arabinose efflux permease
MTMQDSIELVGLSGSAMQPATPADRSRWIALVVLCAGMLMIVLDVTIVNVALPSIQADLRFSQAGLAWVVNAYLIAFGGLLLLAGRLGDLAGRRNVFLTGLGVFTVASLMCGLAQAQWMLIGARFLQGIGGAFTSAVILSMIVTLFPEPREMAKAIGVYAFVASAAARSACWPAVSSRRPSTGTGSSTSISRSARHRGAHRPGDPARPGHRAARRR